MIDYSFYRGKSYEEILKSLFLDETLQKKSPNTIIRYTNIGDMANDIFTHLNINKKVEVKALGDISYKNHYFDLWEKILKSSLENIDYKSLMGYTCKSNKDEILSDVVDYMSKNYNIDLRKAFHEIQKTVHFGYGSSDSFSTALEVFKKVYSEEDLFFIYPESSFEYFIKTAKNKLGNKNIYKIKKPAKDDFFITHEDIDLVYQTLKKKNSKKIFYITPIGNPTGEKIESKKLFSICKYLYKKDPNVIIILDNVYVNLLDARSCESLFKKIFLDKEISQRLLVIESMSKVFGTTGIRVGWIWGSNDEFFKQFGVLKSIEKISFSKILLHMVKRIISNPDIFLFKQKVFKKISENRTKFYTTMKEKYSNFFDFTSSVHFQEEAGMFVFLKLKDNVSSVDVFSKTGIIGVEFALSDGVYIRYSFGHIE